MYVCMYVYIYIHMRPVPQLRVVELGHGEQLLCLDLLIVAIALLVLIID